MKAEATRLFLDMDAPIGDIGALIDFLITAADEPMEGDDDNVELRGLLIALKRNWSDTAALYDRVSLANTPPVLVREAKKKGGE